MSDTPTTPNKLYDAAVGFLVSEKSNSNAWAQVAEFVADHRMNYNPGDEEAEQQWLRHLKREFLVVERQVKKDFQVTRLPVSWRSAKSTSINAVTRGIPLLDTTGSPVPKTDVSKLISAAKKGIIILTPLEKFKHHVDKAMAIFGTLSGTDHDNARLVFVGLGTAVGMVLPKKAAAAMAASS